MCDDVKGQNFTNVTSFWRNIPCKTKNGCCSCSVSCLEGVRGMWITHVTLNTKNFDNDVIKNWCALCAIKEKVFAWLQ